MPLSYKEFKILQELQRNPMISYTDLAKSLNTSLKTIRNTIKKISESPEQKRVEIRVKGEKESQRGKRTPLGFFANIYYSHLGLYHRSFLIRCSSDEQMQKMEFFCDEHPYTSYRSRIFGGRDSGLFMIFHLPRKAFPHLDEALILLKKKNFMTDFTPLVQDESINLTTFPDINAYNPTYNNWDFNFHDFKKNLDTLPPILPNSGNLKDPKIVIKDINLLDVMILREWMSGSGPRKQKSEVLKNLVTDPLHIYRLQEKSFPFKVNRHTISQRMKFLQESGIIKNYGVVFDRSKILIFNRLLFAGNASATFLGRLYHALSKKTFPFSSILTIGSEEKHSEGTIFSLWLEAPPKESTSLVVWLHDKCFRLKTFILSNRGKDMIRYPIYHNNFNPLAKNIDEMWKSSYDYCVKLPLQSTMERFRINP